MITHYRHTGLVVQNIKKSKNFYCNILNLRIIQNFIEEGDYFNNLIGEKNKRAKVIKAISSDFIYLELIEFINSKKAKRKKPSVDFKLFLFLGFLTDFRFKSAKGIFFEVNEFHQFGKRWMDIPDP